MHTPWKSKALCIAAPARSEMDRFLAFVDKRLAPDGVTALVLRVGYRYAFASHPACRAEDPLTRTDAAAIGAACRRAGIELIPACNLFGHQSGRKGVVTAGLLAAYPEMDESRGRETVRADYCRSLCPRHPQALPFATELAAELGEAFGARRVHVGCDEVFEIGLCERCRATPTAVLFAEWVNGLARGLAARGLGTLIWGDRLIPSEKPGEEFWDVSDNGTADALPAIDKDIEIGDWHYWGQERYPSVDRFADAGRRIWICPWCHVDSAKRFVAYAEAHDRGHIEGLTLTTWYSFAHFADALDGTLRVVSEESAERIAGEAAVYHLFTD
jgi:hypothetical protein